MGAYPIRNGQVLFECRECISGQRTIMQFQRVGKEIVEKFASKVCGVNNSVLGARKSGSRESTRHTKSRRVRFPKKKRAPKKSRKPKRRSVKKSRKPKRRSVKRKVSRKRRSVKREVSRKRRSAKRKVSRKRKAKKLTIHPKKAGKGWETVIVPEGTILFRGENAKRANTLLQNMSGTDPRPTWYTKKLDNAVGYIPSGVSGNLYVYKTKRDMKMFKFNSAKNVNKLFKMFHDDDTKIFQGQGRGKRPQKSRGWTMTDFLVHMFLGDHNAKPNAKHYKLVNGYPQVSSDSDLKRASTMPFDLAFARWLCHNGFEGYEQKDMKGKFIKIFPQEICICLPHKNLTLETVLNFPKGAGKNSAKSKKFQDSLKSARKKLQGMGYKV